MTARKRESAGAVGLSGELGRPVAFYTDKSSLFTVNRLALEVADEAVKEDLTRLVGRSENWG